MPRTPQKKKSLEFAVDSEPQPQKFMNHQIIHQISHLPNEESSKKKPMANNLKTCLGGSEGGVREINKMVLAKKYVQQQILLKLKYREKQKEKDYREVVMSDEFVRSHKLYKMLKQQASMAETRQSLQLKNLTQILSQLQIETKAIKDKNYLSKLEIWQKRNELMELKTMLEEEELENKRLAEEYDSASYLQEQVQMEGDYEEEQKEPEKERQEIMQGQEIELGRPQKQDSLIGLYRQNGQEGQKTKTTLLPGFQAINSAHELLSFSNGQVVNLKREYEKSEEQSLSKSIILSQKQQQQGISHNKMEDGLKTKKQKGGELLCPVTHKDQRQKEERQQENHNSNATYLSGDSLVSQEKEEEDTFRR